MGILLPDDRYGAGDGEEDLTELVCGMTTKQLIGLAILSGPVILIFIAMYFSGRGERGDSDANRHSSGGSHYGGGGMGGAD